MRVFRPFPMLFVLLLVPLALPPAAASDPCGPDPGGREVGSLRVGLLKGECVGVVATHAWWPCPPQEWGHDASLVGVGGHGGCEARVWVWRGWTSPVLP